MEIATLLYELLTTGTGLVASGAASEFAKGAGKTAFDALKERLLSRGVASVALVDQAKSNAAYEALIKSDLARQDIVDDMDVRRLAEQLRAAIAALPAETKERYAINIKIIEARDTLSIKNSEGIIAERATAQNITFEGIKAPPGKQ